MHHLSFDRALEECRLLQFLMSVQRSAAHVSPLKTCRTPARELQVAHSSVLWTAIMRAQRNTSNKRVATSDKNKNRRVATRDKHNCRRVACLKSSASCRDFFCRLPASQQMLRAYLSPHLSPHICRHTFVATHLSPHICRRNIGPATMQHLSCIGVTVCNDPCRTQVRSVQNSVRIESAVPGSSLIEGGLFSSA